MNSNKNKPLQLAFDFVESTGQNIFLTGKAGTGKTTFLHDLKARSPKRMIVVAPTGVAAINAGGVTIHSFFQLSFGPQIGLENKPANQMRFSKIKINIIRSLDLLVIDEISMVRADMLDAIDFVLRRFRRNDKAFGGVQLLMIGDLQQLAPVIKDHEWNMLRTHYDTAYFFSSHALQKTAYTSIELLHVYRQQDDQFIALLNKVRDNVLDQQAINLLNSRYIPDFNPKDEEGYITLCTHNAQANTINTSKLAEIKAKSYSFEAAIEGNFPEHAYPTEPNLKLKEGAQVMFIKNDPSPEKKFYNGKIGKITSIEHDSIYVICPDDDEEIGVSPLLWDNLSYSIDPETAEIKEKIEGTYTQIPLKLSWAITIHKSQGLTFEKAIIDAEASFSHGQVYVALSRCKTLEGMVLSTPIASQSIINDSQVSGFIKNVEENQPDEEQLKSAKLIYQHELLKDLFNFSNTLKLINYIKKIFRENSSSIPQIISEQFIQLHDAFLKDIMVVAEKFGIQIKQFLRIQADVKQNHDLQQRIIKASSYFKDKIVSIVIQPLLELDLDIDNKTLNKQIKSNTESLHEECRLKVSGLQSCNKGFDVKELLDAQAQMMLEISKPSPKTKSKAVFSSENIPQPQLYSILREWRQASAIEHNVPAYMIFSQKALISLVNILPRNIKALKDIHGIGAKKISQFGAEIVEIIDEYCFEKGIEGTQIPMKSGDKKSSAKKKENTRHLSYRLFTSGKTIEEIARERSLSENTISSHLAEYVGTGHLDVYLFVNKEKVGSLSNFFRATKSKSMKAAREALGNEYSFQEIKFVLKHLDHLADQL